MAFLLFKYLRNKNKGEWHEFTKQKQIFVISKSINIYSYFANQIIVISNLLLQLNTKILKKSLGKLAESKQAFSDHFK